MGKKIFTGLLIVVLLPIGVILSISAAACKEDTIPAKTQGIRIQSPIPIATSTENLIPSEKAALVETPTVVTPVVAMPTIAVPTLALEQTEKTTIISQPGVEEVVVPTPVVPCISMEHVEEALAEIEKIEQNYPIADILPHGELFFLIHSPSGDGVIIVDIDETVDEDFARNEVFSWIRSQGYDPEDPRYEFRFRAKIFPK